MKPYHYVLLFMAAIAGFTFIQRSNTSLNVLGASVVGNETNEICWNGTKTAQGYQVYYGQASTGNKDSTIYNGLDDRSKCVKLSLLKPCTEYIWNLSRMDGGVWTWQWGSDQHFVTGGACQTAPVPTMAKIVGNGKAVTNWNTVDGAVKYYIFYKAAGDVNWSHSVEVPPQSSSYTINYLDTHRAYMYRVAALVDGKLYWQPEKNLTMQ